jgi:uncharacterized protein Yka (UPF0111/DUF47 family)
MTTIRSTKAACTRIFNQIIAETKKFPQLNYREYFGKLASEQRELVKGVEDAVKLMEIRERAKLDLEQMRRMVAVNSEYVKNRSILEVGQEGGHHKPTRRKTAKK